MTLVDLAAPTSRKRKRPGRRVRTVAFHTVAGTISFLWVVPILLVLMTSFRSQDDVAANGVVSLPESFSATPYITAWTEGDLLRSLTNSMIVTVPTVAIALLLSAAAAFGLSRYRIPLRRTILLVMLAGNLLPVQVILIPVSRISQQVGLFDTLASLIIVQTAFGLGFYTFVLYGFMRSIPGELQDAASIDGAGVFRTFVQIVLPLTRPALAALAALAFTWTFNDLIWSITLIQSEARLPITAGVLSLQGPLVSDSGVIAAATVIAALPCAIVFFIFQRSFIGGLALGALK